MPDAVTFKDLLVPVATIVAAFIGAALSPIFVDGRRHKREAKSLALAFAGEIAAIREIVRERDYPGGIRLYMQAIEQTEQLDFINLYVRREYCAVYKGNVNRIGILEPPLPTCIASFYTQVNAILEDLDALRDLDEKGPEQAANKGITPETLLSNYQQILKLLRLDFGHFRRSHRLGKSLAKRGLH